MHPPSSLKQEFLKKWLMGLQICNSSNKDMSFFERKKAIKLSADLAMASTRNAMTIWSRALISNASRDNDSKIFINHMIDTKSSEKLKKYSIDSAMNKNRVRSKKILKKCCGARRAKKMVPQSVTASSIAKILVQKRTKVLKSLVPGGESMDEFSLIEETLDYIVSLRAQVDVMRQLAKATEHLNRK